MRASVRHRVWRWATLVAVLGALPVQAENAAVEPKWVHVAPKDAGFVVDVPATPQERRQDVGSGDHSGVMRSWSSEDHSQIYIISVTQYAYQDFAKTDPEILLDGLRERLPGQFHARLTDEKKFWFNGAIGRQFDLAGEKKEIRVHVYLKGRDMYQLVVASKGEKLSNDEVNRFLASFRMGAGAASKKAEKTGKGK